MVLTLTLAADGDSRPRIFPRVLGRRLMLRFVTRLVLAMVTVKEIAMTWLLRCAIDW